IIANKKVIQKARSQTVGKLVQKLRKTKDVLAKHPESDKEKTRLRKTTECLAQLKGFKCLEMVQQCLLQEGTNPNVVIASERSTPEELCVAMLRLNKLMHGLVDKFLDTLQLDSSKEAAWREEILETSKRRVKMERTEEKKRKRKELKELKAQARNRREWLEQNKAEGAELEVPLAPEIGEPLNDSKPAAKEEKPEIALKKDAINREVKLNSSKQSIRDRKEKKRKSQRDDKLLKVDSEPSKPSKIPQPPEKVEFPPLKRQRSVGSEQVLQKDRPTHVEDPFFITESGQPYLSTAVVLSEDNDSEAEEEQRLPGFRLKEDRKTGPLHRQAQAEGRNRQEDAAKFNSRKQTDGRHPSWVAKQQQKGVEGFRGKKITFDTEGEPAEVKASNTNTAESSPASLEGKHPSWVAKQKFKPKIAVFQGTKIKFD
ncbi:hypothetical protein KR018_008006, partial [Drosophila ironensis]